MKVSFDDQELAVEIPTAILDKYHDEYQARQNKYVGCAKYERAARIAQRFLKRHLRALVRFNDEEALLQDRMEALLDVQNIELETVQGYKVERLAELDQEWEEELRELEQQEIEHLQQERTLRYDTMEEIETLKAEYYHEKQKHVKYTARLSKEQSKADTLTKLGKLQRRRRKQKRLVKEAKNEIGSLQSQLKQVEDDLDIVAKQNESILACIQAIAERLEKEKIVQTEAKRPLDEDLPALDKSLCVQKKKKKKHKKKKVEESRGCEPTLQCARQRPTYLLNRMQEYIELQCTTSAGQELLDRRQRFSHASEFSAKELSVRSARSCHRHGRHHRVKPS